MGIDIYTHPTHATLYCNGGLFGKSLVLFFTQILAMLTEVFMIFLNPFRKMVQLLSS
jgi:hypothetical protein